MPTICTALDRALSASAWLEKPKENYIRKYADNKVIVLLTILLSWPWCTNASISLDKITAHRLLARYSNLMSDTKLFSRKTWQSSISTICVLYCPTILSPSDNCIVNHFNDKHYGDTIAILKQFLRWLTSFVPFHMGRPFGTSLANACLSLSLRHWVVFLSQL